MKNLKLFLLLFLLAAVFTSCKKDRITEPEPTIVTMEDLEVPSDFDWKTTRDYQFEISTLTGGIVTLSNESGTVTYQKVFVNGSESYTMNVTLPTYEKKIRMAFKGQIVILELTSSSLSQQFNL